MRIYWIPEIKNGQLGMMARPRGNDWLEKEIKRLKLLGMDMVISLLEKQEEKELKIQEEGTFCKKYDLEFLNYLII
ncbi:MAG: hypothetical protein KTR26_18735 [Flammeovirgaceae bacterium]|nr:hypothetical protein [Flammeovirgaceae bacterium]